MFRLLNSPPKMPWMALEANDSAGEALFGRAARLLSVNVGTPQLVETGRRTVLTAIWKQPVEGRVRVRGVNLDGDGQADRTVHGGRDKAVYAYSIEETRTWEGEVGRELGPWGLRRESHHRGQRRFGAVIGERWRVGTTLLEVVQPRQPCFKLGLRMEDPRFVKRFAQASRPGAYLRIVEEGVLAAGDEIAVEAASLPGAVSPCASSLTR
jgi:MOSC domain-containing protein YiiM